MRARDLLELLLLSLLWGLPICSCAPPCRPSGRPPSSRCGSVGGRTAAARDGAAWWDALVLAHPRQLLVLGVPYTALPFMLLAYASLHITAGLVAVLNATAPLFAALIAHFFLKERLGRRSAWGLVIGFVGVAVLMWGSVSFKSGSGLLAVLAVLGTSMLWGVGANYTRKSLSGANPMVITVGSLLAASLFLHLLPGRVAEPESEPPCLGRDGLLGRGQLRHGLPDVLSTAASHRARACHVGHVPESGRGHRGGCLVPRRGGDAADDQRRGGRAAGHRTQPRHDWPIRAQGGVAERGLNCCPRRGPRQPKIRFITGAMRRTPATAVAHASPPIIAPLTPQDMMS